MPVGDLTTLTDAKSWLGVPPSVVVNDARISRLITSCSARIRAYTSRYGFLPQTYTEVRDGNGNQRIVLANWPVISVQSVSIGGSIIQPGTYTAGGNQTAGWFLSPYDGNVPGNPQQIELVGASFWYGKQNVVIKYMAGYQQIDACAVPAGGGPYLAQAPQGPWATDNGVVYQGTGIPLVAVSGAPSVGQYAVSAGSYTFSLADVNALIDVAYGFIPADIYQACLDLVAYQYVQQSRAGIRTHGLGSQESTSYDISGMPLLVSSVLDLYQSKLMVL